MGRQRKVLSAWTEVWSGSFRARASIMAPEGRSGQILTFLPSRPPQRFDVKSARNNHLLNSTTMPVGNVIQFLFCFYNMVTDGWQLWACDLKNRGL